MRNFLRKRIQKKELLKRIAELEKKIFRHGDVGINVGINGAKKRLRSLRF